MMYSIGIRRNYS